MKDLFEQAVSFRTFILNQEAKNRSKFIKYYIPMDISAEYRTRVNNIDSKINILGVVEGWCPDCHINLAVLEKLICTNPNISMKLITRKDAEGRLERYYEDGSLKVPTFIFLDKDFEEKGAFIEKPDKVKGIDINTVEGAKVQMSYIAGKFIDETALQLLKLIEKTA